MGLVRILTKDTPYKKAIIIHGPQGSGKTKFAREMFNGVTQNIRPSDLDVCFNGMMVCDTLFIDAGEDKGKLREVFSELESIIRNKKIVIRRPLREHSLHDGPSRVIIEMQGDVPRWMAESSLFFLIMEMGNG